MKMKNHNLIQQFVSKWHAAKSLAEFIRYFSNWQEIWSAYKLAKPLPAFTIRSTPNSFLIQHGSEDDPIFLFREIFIQRCYTPSWFYEPSPNDTVMDLGANIGMFMLYLAWRSPGIKVHCFEPSSRTRSVLKAQVEANHLHEKVSVYPYAIFDQTGVTSLKLSENSGHQSLFDSEYVDRRSEVVEMLSLSDAFEKCGVQKVNLLKIDVEGAEIEIVESTPEKIWRSLDKVVVEYHDLFRPGCRERVCNCLSANGFRSIQVRSCPPTDDLGIIYAQK